MFRPAVFLDRDGTLIEEAGYLDRVERMRLFPWSIDAVRLLIRGGYVPVVVSNQAGVARGYFAEQVVRDLNAQLGAWFAEGGAPIAGFYYCPHHPEGSVDRYRVACDCRKPRPAMVLAAARDLDLDLARSFVIGDKWLDVALAQAVGATGILVRTGYGETAANRPDPAAPAGFIASDLMEAAGWILRRTGRGAADA
jgi:D,D-heptose 1,7-bisphosphate phosphatase